jgi:hypothetical protein
LLNPLLADDDVTCTAMPSGLTTSRSLASSGYGALKVSSFVIDGEAVAVNETGLAVFD